MAESLRRLVNIGTFTTLQDKLEQWLETYKVRFNDFNNNYLHVYTHCLLRLAVFREWRARDVHWWRGARCHVLLGTRALGDSRLERQAWT